MIALTWEQAAAWRMDAHGLAARTPDWPDVVERVCGLHAQVMSSAELTLWARVEGLERSTVAHALWETRRLVKTWAMRGTLHLLPAAEYGLWLGALGEFEHYRRDGWLRGWGLTRAEMDALIAAVDVALDGRLLTRAELAAEVTRTSGSERLGELVGGSWGSLLKPAAYEGRLCFASSAGQNVRFTRPETWLGTIARVEPADARRELARRFLAVNGPTTREDYARWWGLTPAQAGRRLASLDDKVEEVSVEGERRLMLAGDGARAAACGPAGVVRLVPAFDQYVVGATRHAAALLPSADLRARIYRAQGWLSAVVLVDGLMEGVWRWERRGRRLAVAVEPFRRQPAAVRAGVAREAERLAEFLGGALELTWS